MISRHQLDDFYKDLLKPDDFSDYGPNGLQVEGSASIGNIVFAVSATQASVAEAINRNADALVVHHGLFWHFHGVRTLTGVFARRVLPLVKHDINLFAYHLPLDGHPDIGNAASLGRLIECTEQHPFGDYKGMPTGIKGILKSSMPAQMLKERLEKMLNHPVIMSSPDPLGPVRTLGIITGGANGEWLRAAEEGLDAYITGEISEHDWHDSREHGVHMFAGGHNATEQFGVQALMEKTRLRFGVECSFFESENPA
ncbi:MAG: Nif3-like dinuclear metal center hexameric protein [Gammaproteobacteria bacterium]